MRKRSRMSVLVANQSASRRAAASSTAWGASASHVVIGDLDPAVEGFVGVLCDVTSPSSVEALRRAAVDAFGAVHVICLNAGVAASGPLLETSLETWRWLLDVNVLGVVNGVHAFGPGLVAQGEGHIVTTASAAGLISPAVLGAYAATKHAVVGLSAVLRDEL